MEVGTGGGRNIGDFIEIVLAHDGVEVDAWVLYFQFVEFEQSRLDAIDNCEELAFWKVLACHPELFRPVPESFGDVLVEHRDLEAVFFLDNIVFLQFDWSKGISTDMRVIYIFTHLQLFYDSVLQPLILLHFFLDDGPDGGRFVQNFVRAVSMGLETGFIALLALLVAHLFMYKINYLHFE